MKKILLSFVFAMALLFTANGQYKNAVSIDLISFGAPSLEYERFVYSENNHHFSVKGVMGYSIPWSGLVTGFEAVYGFGNHHRVEVGLGGAFLHTRFGDVDDYREIIGALRINYAYYSKSNPMIYRIGWMPQLSHRLSNDFSSDLKTFYHLNTITIGIGYRF